MSEVQVSFLVTAYNCEGTIGRTLECLVNQNFDSFEIVVVEDGSSDGTAEKLKEISEKLPGVNAYFPGRLGRAKALNFGLSKCKGKYLAINDADDYSYSNRLLKQVSYLEAHQEVGILGSSFEICEYSDRWINHAKVEDEDIRKAFIHGQPIQHSTVMFRKELVDKVGGYNEKLAFLLDRDIFLRVAQISKMHQLEEVLVTINRSPSQYFKTNFKGIRRNWMSTRYRLQAADLFGFSWSTKLIILCKFAWSLVQNVKKWILNRH